MSNFSLMQKSDTWILINAKSSKTRDSLMFYNFRTQSLRIYEDNEIFETQCPVFIQFWQSDGVSDDQLPRENWCRIDDVIDFTFGPIYSYKPEEYWFTMTFPNKGIIIFQNITRHKKNNSEIYQFTLPDKACVSLCTEFAVNVEITKLNVCACIVLRNL
jgi:hypothetical protein